jgi:hypothetical protein
MGKLVMKLMIALAAHRVEALAAISMIPLEPAVKRFRAW